MCRKSGLLCRNAVWRTKNPNRGHLSGVPPLQAAHQQWPCTPQELTAYGEPQPPALLRQRTSTRGVHYAVTQALMEDAIDQQSSLQTQGQERAVMV